MSQEHWEEPIDWQELDRLVDGQISTDEYRELIAEIEAHPNGWRQCALAFLEHQALQRELSMIQHEQPFADYLPGPGAFSGMARSEPVTTTSEPVATPARVTQRNLGTSGPALAWFTMATCILVGLTVGMSMQNEFRESLRRPTVVKFENPPREIPNYERKSLSTGTAKIPDYNRVQNPRMVSPEFKDQIDSYGDVSSRCRLQERKSQCDSKEDKPPCPMLRSDLMLRPAE